MLPQALFICNNYLFTFADEYIVHILKLRSHFSLFDRQQLTIVETKRMKMFLSDAV